MLKYDLENDDDKDIPASPPAQEDDEDSDQDTITQSKASDASPGQTAPDLSKLMVTPEELQQNAATHRRNALLGAISNNLSNRQSAGNFMLGHMNPQQSSAGMVQAMNQAADAPIQQKKQLLSQYQQIPQLQMQANMQDPTSPLSKLTKASAMTTVQRLMQDPSSKKDKNAQQAFQSMSDLISDPKTSAYDVQMAMEKNPLIKEEFSASIQGQRLMGMMAMANARLSQGQDRINIQRDNQAANAAGSFDKDPNLQALNRQQQQIQRDKHTLETAQIVTPQLLNEVQIGIANAIAGGKSAALTNEEKTEFNSAEIAMKNLEQRLTNSPKDVGSPEVKNYITNVLDRLDAAYGKNMSARAQQLSIGRKYSSNPAAQDAIKAKLDSYSQSAGPSGNDASLIPSANASDGSGSIRVVSPEGKMGIIPAANLQKALQRGFKRVE